MCVCVCVSIGRYGDPLNFDGDVAALLEYADLAKPDALIYLGIPCACVDRLEWPNHRMYGAARLPYLFNGFDVIGAAVGGKWVDFAAAGSPYLVCPKDASWQLQPVNRNTIIHTWIEYWKTNPSFIFSLVVPPPALGLLL
jgi:hypothetical protein